MLGLEQILRGRVGHPQGYLRIPPSDGAFSADQARYRVTASRMTHAKLTRFSVAIRSSPALSSAAMLIERRSTDSPGTGCRDLGGRFFIAHQYAPLMHTNQFHFVESAKYPLAKPRCCPKRTAIGVKASHFFKA